MKYGSFNFVFRNSCPLLVSVGDYVKHGRDRAKIEIHLKNESEKDSVITRVFTNKRNLYKVDD